MIHRLSFAALFVVAACASEPDAIHLTSSDVDAQLAQLAPPVRQAMQNPARRKQFVDNLIRLEVLARAAEQEGLANDPAVRFAVKKAMAARYEERFLEKHRATHPIIEADVRRYFEEHRDDFSRPARVHVELLFLAADEGSPLRAATAVEARALLTQILSDERSDGDAFERAARERSDDALTRPLGGDLGVKTREELDAWGPQVADVAFALETGQTCPTVLASARGLTLVRVTERFEAQTRGLDEVKGSIASRLAGQRADEEFERVVARLRETVQLDGR